MESRSGKHQSCQSDRTGWVISHLSVTDRVWRVTDKHPIRKWELVIKRDSFLTSLRELVQCPGFSFVEFKSSAKISEFSGVHRDSELQSDFSDRIVFSLSRWFTDVQPSLPENTNETEAWSRDRGARGEREERERRNRGGREEGEALWLTHQRPAHREAFTDTLTT